LWLVLLQTWVCRCLYYMLTLIHYSSYVPKSGIARSHGCSIFSFFFFLRNLHTGSHSGYTNLHSWDPLPHSVALPHSSRDRLVRKRVECLATCKCLRNNDFLATNTSLQHLGHATKDYESFLQFKYSWGTLLPQPGQEQDPSVCACPPKETALIERRELSMDWRFKLLRQTKLAARGSISPWAAHVDEQSIYWEIRAYIYFLCTF
jgi:hypothetical protein